MKKIYFIFIVSCVLAGGVVYWYKLNLHNKDKSRDQQASGPINTPLTTTVNWLEDPSLLVEKLSESTSGTLYQNPKFKFSFRYPSNKVSIKEGDINLENPWIVHVVNLFTIPHGQDRNALIQVANIDLSNLIERDRFLGGKSNYNPNGDSIISKSYIEVNGIRWLKINYKTTGFNYLTEKGGYTYWIVGATINEIDIEHILRSFKILD